MGNLNSCVSPVLQGGEYLKDGKSTKIFSRVILCQGNMSGLRRFSTQKGSKMKRKQLIISTLVMCMVVEAAQADFTFGEPSFLGEPVSSPSWEFSVCISPDEKELFFSSAGTYGWHDLYVVKRQSPNDPWGERQILDENVNSSVPDTFPSIPADGLSLYFGRGSTSEGAIWVTTRQSLDGLWESAKMLGPSINKGSANGTPAVSADGLSLYFARREAGNLDIFVATRPTPSDQWSQAEPLPAHINTHYDEVAPFVTPDGRCLLFCSATRDYSNDIPRPDGVGEADIWMSKRLSTSDEWGPPVFLPVPVNTTNDELGACISGDGSTLYFCSDRGDDYPGYGVYQAPILPIVDLNEDGKVDGADMCMIVDHWGENYPLCDIGPTPLGDGIVDVQDLIVLAERLFEDYRLIHHWKLDEDSGSIAHDSIHSIDATLHGAPHWQPFDGILDGALSFDGQDDYLTTPFILDPAAGSFSIFAWIKGTERGKVVISQNDSSGLSNLWLGTNASNGGLITRLMHPPFSPLISQVVVIDGQWHHVGLVYDYQNLHRYLYVDGTEVAGDSEAVGGVKLDGGLFMGVGEGINPNTFWSGLIDDIRIYNNSLSAAEVQALSK